MKSKLLKNSIKEIKGTFRRFVSIFLMSFLGVGFFAGLVASGPDMKETLDKYYDNHKTFDISVVSTLGLTQDDINELSKVEGIEEVYGVNSVDKEVRITDENYISKIIEINSNINTISLTEGNMPQNDNECVMDNIFANTNDIKIGDTVKIDEKEYKIVGKAQSPLYITFSKGTTNIGSGSIDCFIYINKIEQDYYANIYLTVSDAKKLVTDSKKYNNLVEEAKQKIEQIKQNREDARYEEIRQEAEEEINKARNELEENRQEANKKISDAESKISQGQKEIETGKRQLQNSKTTLLKNKKDAEEAFSNAQKQITENEKNLQQAKDGLTQAEDGLASLNEKLEKVEEDLQEAKNNKTALEKLGQDTTQINEIIGQLEYAKSGLTVEKTKLETQINDLRSTISLGETQINNAKEELTKNKVSTNNQLKEAQNKINNAQKEITENENKIVESKNELENQKAELNNSLKETEDKIADAEKDLEDIEKPVWYISTRADNSGYSTYTDSVQSMINIAKLFPLVFYIIAILTSLTSMTRMVDEERLEIGTLKALGYTNLQILGKYILYSLSATVLGGIIGMAIGFKFLPNTIWTIYKIMFDMAELSAPFRIDVGLIGLGIAILCICGATTIACINSLKNMPAKLMRPKAPKAGKRIFLERINFIWKRLNFSQKITTRNIFRYKKRAMMTIVGITGCTALILAGFGLRDSVTGIVSYQYGEICKYQELININDEKAIDLIDGQYVKANMQTVELNGKDANLMVSDTDIKEVINFYDKKTEEIVDLSDDGILITDKLADLINVKAGQDIKIKIDEKEYTFKIKNVLKNYIYNYVYMSKPLYESSIGKYEINTIIVKDKLSEEKKEEILENDAVFALMDVEETTKSVEDMLQSLNYVVIILIVSAAMLAFVVLYNLANINIGERVREIATLKVLGFYDPEVDNYISKETRIFTAIGIALGLVAGYVLCNFLITTCEVEMVRFVKQIHLASYIYSILITILFTMIVNIIVHGALKKINMIESLKSVE